MSRNSIQLQKGLSLTASSNATALRRSARRPSWRGVGRTASSVRIAAARIMLSSEFQYRFNRRADLPAMLDRLGFVATQAAPRPRGVLKIQHVAG
jgi:hypothetical protein